MKKIAKGEPEFVAFINFAALISCGLRNFFGFLVKKKEKSYLKMQLKWKTIGKEKKRTIADRNWEQENKIVKKWKVWKNQKKFSSVLKSQKKFEKLNEHFEKDFKFKWCFENLKISKKNSKESWKEKLLSSSQV